MRVTSRGGHLNWWVGAPGAEHSVQDIDATAGQGDDLAEVLLFRQFPLVAGLAAEGDGGECPGLVEDPREGGIGQGVDDGAPNVTNRAQVDQQPTRPRRHGSQWC